VKRLTKGFIIDQCTVDKKADEKEAELERKNKMKKTVAKKTVTLGKTPQRGKELPGPGDPKPTFSSSSASASSSSGSEEEEDEEIEMVEQSLKNGEVEDKQTELSLKKVERKGIILNLVCCCYSLIVACLVTVCFAFPEIFRFKQALVSHSL